MPITADTMIKVSALLSTIPNHYRDIRNNQLRDFFSPYNAHVEIRFFTCKFTINVKDLYIEHI